MLVFTNRKNPFQIERILSAARSYSCLHRRMIALHEYCPMLAENKAIILIKPETTMKTLIKTLALVSLSFGLLSFNAQALDRAVIAQDAMSVTPLLNGQIAPDTTLKMADGSPVSFKALTMQKPTIVLFYRGGWCPYCSRQLAELKDIEKDLADAGYQLLAISPESPARLQEQKLETEFLVTLLSDNSLETIKSFGVGYYVDSKTESKYKGYGIGLTSSEEGRAVLPAPAIFILDTKGQIQFSYVNPDFRVRPSAKLILAAANALK